MRHRKTVVVFCAALVACGGLTERDRTSAGSGATGGGAGTGGLFGTGGGGLVGAGGAGVAGSGGQAAATGTGGATATGGSAGAAACAKLDEQFISFELRTGDGSRYGCGPGLKLGAIGVQGVSLGWVNTGTVESAIAIDTCPPDADCAFGPAVIRVGMGGNDRVSPPKGALLNGYFVAESTPLGCQQRVLVTQMAKWAGLNNPFFPAPEVVLAAADGVYPALGAAPFSVGAQALGCDPETQPNTCGLAPDTYLLEFRADVAPLGISVPQGSVVSDWLLGGKGVAKKRYRIKNLRSYSTGSCSNDSHWGWWVFAEAWAT